MKKFIKSLFSGMILTSVFLNSINVFANQNQIVKISVGNNIANVNGNDTTLSIAPYIQKSSGAMMIPLRFVSTSLGIDENNIKYNPNTKEISIAYNGKTVKFIVGTNKLIIDEKDFSMLLENKYPIYTEIKNGSTFIPLRSLELAFGNIKIDWENSTKTAILKNIINNIEQPINNNFLVENSLKNNTLTEQDIRVMEKEMINLVNNERESLGLNKLEISNKLMNTAKEKSRDMANNDYFSHTNLDNYNMAIDLGIAENIGQQLFPINQFDSFKNSLDGHYENMINPNYKYIGVGFSFKLDYDNPTYDGSPSIKTYWTQQFSSNDKWAN